MKYPQDIVIEEITENKEAFIELLLIADPSVDMITKYLSKGHLFSRPLKSILLSDIQQYNYQTSIVNLQVFVSLGIETCRFL